MKVLADLDLCQGHAVCESEAPDVFEVPKHGKVAILEPEFGAELRGAVDEAIKHCPTHALSLEEN
jgi:ferredoxin